MFSDDAVELQQKPSVLPRNQALRKKVKKVLGGDIDEKFQVDNLKESPMGDEQEKRNGPGLGQATGPSDLYSGDDQYSPEVFIRQVADTEGMDHVTKLVLFTIGLYADDQGICNQTKQFLARKTGVGYDTVRKKIDDAQAQSWLVVEYGHPSALKANLPVYRVVMQT